MEAVVPSAAGIPAIRCAGHERDYRAFLERAARIATGLRAAGVEPGDRIAVVMRNEPAHLEITAAAALAGASAVPVNWHFRQHELRHVLTDSGSKVVFAHTDLLAGVSAVLPDGVRIIEAAVPAGVAAACGFEVPAPSGDHPLLDRWLAGHPPLDRAAAEHPPTVIYSSGTTGSPKGYCANRSPGTGSTKRCSGSWSTSRSLRAAAPSSPPRSTTPRPASTPSSPSRPGWTSR